MNVLKAEQQAAMTMKSDLLLLNDTKVRFQLFAETPLFTWIPLDYKFLPKRKTIIEYFCKFKQPLHDSTIDLEYIDVDLLYGCLSCIKCSGINLGFCLKLPKSLSIIRLNESLIVKPKLEFSDGNELSIDLSLPDLQIMTRDNSTMVAILRNEKCHGRHL